jgi:exodeoxyribonuclease VII small subunit
MSDEQGQGQAAGELDEVPFEQLLERLEGVVDQLERGELPLEDALGAFEGGVRLSRAAMKRLEQAERRIEHLLTDDGVERVEPFGDYES